MIFIFVLTSCNPKEKELKLWMCESSYNGDCVIYNYDNTTILCDTGVGDLAYDSFKEGLKEFESNHIDYFIISHFHDDHISNLEKMIDDNYIDEKTKVYLPPTPDFTLAIERVPYSYDYVMNLLKDNNISYNVPNEFEELNINALKLSFFNCDHDYYYDLMKKNELVNDYNICSLCFRIDFYNQSIVSTGDSGGLLWKKYIDYMEKCTIYKAHHHCVNSSYNEVLIDEYGDLFFKKLNPEIVITSLGKTIADADINNDHYNRFQGNHYGLQEWCERNNVKNYVTGYKDNKELFIKITSGSYKIISESAYCIR